MTKKVFLIIGAGQGISYSFAKHLKAQGFEVALASRDLNKLNPLATLIGAESFKCDTSSNQEIIDLF